LLEAVLLEQVEDYIGPFDLDIDGFDESWWTPPVGRVGSSHHDWLSFILDGREVARAEIDYEAQLGGDYQGPPLPRRIIDIDFLEVRSDRRGEGIGKQAVELIKARYPGKVITAFSEEADEFWAAVGWRRYPRTDGSTHHRPLFVWDARQQQL
jgi:GNAT superfamily N-acetyltransferase